MGLLDYFRPTAPARALDAADQITAALEHATAGVHDPSSFPIASPWSSSDNLQRLVAEDIFGSDLPVNTRSAAMRLATIARARNLLVTTCSRFPLRQLTADDQPAPNPIKWLTNPGDGSSPQHRIAWTVDDLIFYGWSCWWRRGDEAGGRVNQGDWAVNADGQVEIHGVPQKPQDVILIPGYHEGLLTYGVDVLEDARSLYRIVRQRLHNPVPQLELHQTGGPPLTQTQIDALIAGWTKARNSPNGGVGYTNEVIELKEHGAGDSALMVDARNAASVDLARIVGVHAGLVDATAPKASLNYETQTGRNQEFTDFDLPLYLEPIAARLSLDDVCPAGERIRFDLGDFTGMTPSPTGPKLED